MRQLQLLCVQGVPENMRQLQLLCVQGVPGHMRHTDVLTLICALINIRGLSVTGFEQIQQASQFTLIFYIIVLNESSLITAKMSVKSPQVVFQVSCFSGLTVVGNLSLFREA